MPKVYRRQQQPKQFSIQMSLCPTPFCTVIEATGSATSVSPSLFLCLTLQFLTEQFLSARPFTSDALYFTLRNT